MTNQPNQLYYVNQKAELDPEYYTPNNHCVICTSKFVADALGEQGFKAVALLNFETKDDLPDLPYDAIVGFDLETCLQINPMLGRIEWNDSMSGQPVFSLEALLNQGSVPYYSIETSIQEATPAIYELAEQVRKARHGDRKRFMLEFCAAFNRLDVYDQICHRSTLSLASGIKQRELNSIIEALLDAEINGDDFRTISYRDLLTMEIPEPDWLIYDFVEEGAFAIGSGKAKSGKTIFFSGMALAVSAGAEWMGRKTKKVKTLYLALEDTDYSIKQRILKQTQDDGLERDIDFKTEFENLSGAGIKHLREEIISNDYKLVIIDTLTSATGRFDQMDALQVAITFKALRKVSKDTRSTIFLVDHQSKGSKEGIDISDVHLGSIQKRALVTFQLSFEADKENQRAVVRANGNFVGDVSMSLKWNTEALSWIYEGDAVEIKKTRLDEAVIEAIKTYGGEATNKQIAEEIDRSLSHTNKVLKRLQGKKVIERRPQEDKGRVLLNILL